MFQIRKTNTCSLLTQLAAQDRHEPAAAEGTDPDRCAASHSLPGLYTLITKYLRKGVICYNNNHTAALESLANGSIKLDGPSSSPHRFEAQIRLISIFGKGL